ncbi:hypothetical protein EIP91_007905 [Steccherinum ochraceum]|uniref:Endonuclease/exonuclease/phosphatase domain-containing protein n=1 Tax=Steccherinum ochraceum TaxID=92696 RepID=A0A4R0RUD7_9APHY|nr:hypothetical protein EIP91_007905 [Steccherinum ochraceum]
MHEYPDRIIPLSIRSYSKKDPRWRRRRAPQDPASDPRPTPSSLRIVSWNIDFMQDRAVTRLHAALDHLKSKLHKGADGTKLEPCCVLLQEVALDAFPALLSHAWVQEHFQVTPTSPDKGWPRGAGYGVVTLVSRSLQVIQCQSLEYGCSVMGRTALMVDVRMKPASADDEEYVTLRVANTHLESLPMGAEARPVQLSSTAAKLREVDCGVVCGDMNAIGPSDTDIHADAGLEDAWTKGDDSASGFTWGYQPRCQFPAGRLDKVLYTPSEYFKVDEPRKIGVGLKTADGQWASDHYGLMTTVRIL